MELSSNNVKNEDTQLLNNFKCLIDMIYIIRSNVKTEEYNKIIFKIKSLNVPYENVYSLDLNYSNYRLLVKEFSKNVTYVKIFNLNSYYRTMNHLSVFKKAKEKNYNCVLVLEDSINFSNDFETRIFDILKIPNEWNVLYLGTFGNDKKEVPNYLEKEYYRTYSSYGIFAYLIKKELYNIIIEKLEKNKEVIDNLFLNLQKDYIFYAIRKELVTVNPDYKSFATVIKPIKYSNLHNKSKNDKNENNKSENNKNEDNFINVIRQTIMNSNITIQNKIRPNINTIYNVYFYIFRTNLYILIIYHQNQYLHQILPFPYFDH